jgi:5,10-methylenetetrahydromethanopterin reductase
MEEETIMRFGFMMVLSPREPILRFPDIASHAEAVGFDLAWLGESQMISKDAYTALALAATKTEKIFLGPGVANPVTRHPTVLANTMVALNEISDGRAILGIGAGDSAVHTIGARPATVNQLRADVECIKVLFDGGETVINETPARLLTAGEPVPIWIAASQPRMLQLAGAVADGVVVMGGAEPGITEWQINHVRRGAESSGRSLDDVFVDLWFGISLADDTERALQDVRPWATSQARLLARWKELPKSVAPFREEFERAFQQYDFFQHLSRHAKHSTEISDEFVDFIAVAGPPERCIEKIRPLLDLKIDQLTFTLLPGGRMERISRFGEELIPLIMKSEETK